MPKSEPKSTTKLCANCGEPIAPARLEAMPSTTLCINCARKFPIKVDTSRIEIAEASKINRNGFAPSD